ncbi:reverse transcriptase [Apostichopus japonicus]|uniref:Reverse transcriptase n=1 Tax=Stichopus japonicus TaxID=307972 RepID=A0A2G8L6P5_STIJA|nr:reverse transcriptase [Apostichopus japonicus]
MIKVNGIWLGYGAPEATTWAEKADQVEARLDTFSHRWLSLPGKVTVVNRFIVPLLWYGVGFFFDTTGPDPFPITGQRRHALLGSILRLVTLFRIKEEGGPHVLLNVAPLCYTHIVSFNARACVPVGLPTAISPDVWRSVCCKSLDSRLRDLAWRIAHGVLITNHFRLVRWRLGDGICPRVGCKAIETMQHLLLECPFVRLVWDWFHAFVIGVIGCTQWAISSDFVLYGLLPLCAQPGLGICCCCLPLSSGDTSGTADAA